MSKNTNTRKKSNSSKKQKKHIVKILLPIIIAVILGLVCLLVIIFYPSDNNKNDKKLFIEGAQNDSLTIPTTLNTAGTHQFYCYDDQGKDVTDAIWSFNSSNPSLSIDQTGLLSWGNNLDPFNSNGENDFKLICEKSSNSVVCNVSLVVNETTGDEICPNSYFEFVQWEDGEEGFISLKEDVDRNSIKKIVIPTELNGKKVEGLIGMYVGSTRQQSFSRCNSLTSVIIPPGIKSIGREAFRGCRLLQNVSLPDTLTDIGYCAFRGCPISNLALTHTSGLINPTFSLVDGKAGTIVTDNLGRDNAFLILSSNLEDGESICLENVGEDPFWGVISTVSTNLLTVPKTINNKLVTGIGSKFFYSNGTTDLTLHNSLQTIGDYAFAGLASLKKIKFIQDQEVASPTFKLIEGDTGNIVNDNSFCENGFLMKTTDIETNENNITINATCGSGGITTRTLHIPEKINNKEVREIGDHAFASNQIDDLILPNSIEYIGNYAFYGGIDGSFTLPNNLKSIGNYAFYECFHYSGYVYFNIPDTVEYLGAYFVSSANKIHLPNNPNLSLSAKSFYECLSLNVIDCSFDQEPDWNVEDCDGTTGERLFAELSYDGELYNHSTEYSSEDLCNYFRTTYSLPDGWYGTQ